MLPLKSFTDACITVIEIPPTIIKMKAFSIMLFLELSDKNTIILLYHVDYDIDTNQTMERAKHPFERR